MELILGGIAAFVMVFLKGLQTQNVIHRKYLSAAVTSWLMAGADIALISFIVKSGWDMLMPLGIGAMLGILLSIYIHGKYINRAK